MKPRLLDLFCGAGGAGRGYQEAGFDVVGVDVSPQPRYPFEFHQCDAMDFLSKYGKEYDAIHASPPCQAYTALQHIGRARNGDYPDHPDMVAETRLACQAVGRPYIIENVPQAPLDGITLCGTMFPEQRLKVYRHRRFESNVLLWQPPHHPHHDHTPPPGRGPSPKGFISVCGAGGIAGMTAPQILAYWSASMGIDWMTRRELAQAIPPAYTEYIGKILRCYV